MKKRILLIISIFVVVLILFSSSYALLFKSNQTDKQEYTTGMLEITSETLSGSVTLNNPLPMSDSDGENTTPYVFRITNTGNLTYKFNIMLLSTTTDNQISSNYIKLKVNNESITTLNSLTDGIILSNITLKPTEYIDVTLRVWLSEDTPNTEIGKTFNAKITTEGEAVYTTDPNAPLDSSGANDPDLVQGLIPIRYETTTDSDGNNVTKVLKEDAIPQKVTATCNEMGDVNGDGNIDGNDSIYIQLIISGSVTSTDSQLVCADVDGDGEITKTDANLILEYIVGGSLPMTGTRTGTVTRPNTWYNYDEQMWANAVLVSETNRDTYQNAEYGTEIAQSDILAYYVWIPRYKYKVWNISKQAGEESTYAYNAYTEGIDIVFENGKKSTGRINCEYNYNVDTTNGGIDLSATTAETCTGSNGQYYTHPAFTFGNNELKGFWISKYEISSSDPTATYGGGNVTNLTVRSLPNVNSWRNISIGNISTVIQNMQTSSNIYGLSTSRTNTDSHMLTNFEWGAVAYLTNSKYGRCTDGSCTKVTINNCNTYVTGIGADSVSAGSSSTTCTTAANQYNGTYGKLASTTGNITGVYDMSGGSREYVMGNISKVTTGYTFYSSGSGFSSDWYTTDTAKNLTTYAYDSNNYDNQAAYNRGRLGDATAETLLSATINGGWNSAYSSFPYSGAAWFSRGGDFGSDTGIFAFYSYAGSRLISYSSRAALVSISS